MSNFNSFRDNLPPGFSGLEGETEKTFIYELHSEIILEDVNEESAYERVLDMSVRELLQLESTSLDIIVRGV